MVSIITAIYKSDKYLSKLFEHQKKFANFLKSKNFPFEIIIVSTLPNVRELEYLKQVEKESWARVLRLDSLGVFAAWNFGIAEARGDLVGFWNADDVRFPEAIIEADSLTKSGADIIYFPFVIKRYLNIGLISLPLPFLTTKIKGKILDFERRKFQIEYNCGPHFMFTKEAYKKVGPFDEQFKIAGDFDWCARASQMGLSFSLGKEFSGIFRVDGRGLSAGVNNRLVVENNLVFERQGAQNKIIPGDYGLEGSYDSNFILFKGNKNPFSNKS